MLTGIGDPAAGPATALALHAPDGFLTVPVAAVMWVLTLIVLAVAVRRTNATLDERSVPLLGVMAAFIFAAQMFNFQVIGGTSGHLLGGVLAAVLLGPWAATIVMACVVAVQALVFQDGGLVVLGANIFNMGVDRHARRLRDLRDDRQPARWRGPRPAARCSDRRVGLGRRAAPRRWRSSSPISGTTPLELDAARDGRRPRPDRHRRGGDHGRGARVHRRNAAGPLRPAPVVHDVRGARVRARLGRWWWVAGLAIAALVVIVLAPLASPDPDGLERVAEDQGFLERARDAIYNVFPDYSAARSSRIRCSRRSLPG